MDFTTLINWTSSFPFKGLLGGIFHFYSNSNRTLCKQTVKTLIRRRILWRLISLFAYVPQNEPWARVGQNELCLLVWPKRRVSLLEN